MGVHHAALVSVVLCVATMGAWFASYWDADAISYALDGNTFAFVQSAVPTFVLSRFTGALGSVLIWFPPPTYGGITSSATRQRLIGRFVRWSS
jgi:hypothetical protein